MLPAEKFQTFLDPRIHGKPGTSARPSPPRAFKLGGGVWERDYVAASRRVYTHMSEIYSNTPLFSHPQYKSHVKTFSSKFDKKCDLYSGKYSKSISVPMGE